MNTCQGQIQKIQKEGWNLTPQHMSILWAIVQFHSKDSYLQIISKNSEKINTPMYVPGAGAFDHHCWPRGWEFEQLKLQMPGFAGEVGGGMVD